MKNFEHELSFQNFLKQWKWRTKRKQSRNFCNGIMEGRGFWFLQTVKKEFFEIKKKLIGWNSSS